MPKEYRTIQGICANRRCWYGAWNMSPMMNWEIELASGEVRRCKVLEVNGSDALVQLFESLPVSICPTVRCVSLDASMELGVSEDMLGRVFDGLAVQIHDGPEYLLDARMDINGLPMNRAQKLSGGIYPDRCICSIDGLNTLVRGQKLPLFSASGMPHAQLAAQIARQAKVRGTDENFAVVFAAMGITFEESNFFVESFKETGAIDRTVLFVNLQTTRRSSVSQRRVWR